MEESTPALERWENSPAKTATESDTPSPSFNDRNTLVADFWLSMVAILDTILKNSKSSRMTAGYRSDSTPLSVPYQNQQ